MDVAGDGRQVTVVLGEFGLESGLELIVTPMPCDAGWNTVCCPCLMRPTSMGIIYVDSSTASSAADISAAPLGLRGI